MSTKLPQNAQTMRHLLAQYLTSCKTHMNNKSDQVWIQGEIDRFTEQINMLTQGVTKRERKATGITRRVDELGRLVIPKELRKTHNILNGDSIEIFVDDEKGIVILQKYDPACSFCAENIDDLTMFRGKRICETCLEELFNQTT